MQKKLKLAERTQVSLHFDPELLAMVDQDIANKKPVIRSRNEFFDDLLRRIFAPVLQQDNGSATHIRRGGKTTANKQVNA